LFIACLPLLSCGCVVIPLAGLLDETDYSEQVIERGDGLFAGKVAVIELSGVLSSEAGGFLFTSVDNSVSGLRTQLDLAAEDRGVAGVLLKISSPGGEVTACDNLYHEIKKFRAETGKPVVAYIENVGASGGLYAAMGADAVMCHPTAIVGSIGVIMQSMDLSRAIAAFGVEIDPIKSGKMKDLNTPWRSITKDERQVLQKLVDDMFQRFVDVVDSGREKLDRAKVLELADGRVFSGMEAARVGLVDRTGYIEDAVSELTGRLGGDQRKPTLIRYTRKATGGANIYSRGNAKATRENSITLRLDGLNSSPGLYYLWKPGI
jgi:protease-4